MHIELSVGAAAPDYLNLSAGRARDHLLSGGCACHDPSGMRGVDLVMMNRVTGLVPVVKGLVERGRFMDFGHLPLRFLKAECARAEELLADGRLVPPFSDGCVFSFITEFNGYDGAVARFVVSDLPAERTMVIHLAMRLPNGGPEQLAWCPFDHGQTACFVTATGDIDEPIRLLDAGYAVCCALAARADIAPRRIVPDEKLQRARMKARKPAIPPTWAIDAQDYITLVSTHQRPKRSRQGGTHASPVPHERRAHRRRLDNGRTVKVRASFVNMLNAAAVRRRFYSFGGR
jgi:hypothetical protein